MLKIDVEPIKGILFIRLSGKLNKKNIPKFKKEVFDLLKKVQVKNIVLNIKNVDFIDSYGKNAIVNSINICNFNKSFICLKERQKPWLKNDFKCFKLIKDELKVFDLINF